MALLTSVSTRCFLFGWGPGHSSQLDLRDSPQLQDQPGLLLLESQGGRLDQQLEWTCSVESQAIFGGMCWPASPCCLFQGKGFRTFSGHITLRYSVKLQHHTLYFPQCTVMHNNTNYASDSLRTFFFPCLFTSQTQSSIKMLHFGESLNLTSFFFSITIWFL